MGTVYADITLRNAMDVAIARRGKGQANISSHEIRQTTVTALVDTGAATLVINEELQQQLGLEIARSYRAELADGSKQVYSYSEPVEIHWKDREVSCQAIIVPRASEVLLGAIPLEAMDLMVNPVDQQLIGAHGDEVLLKLK